MKTVVHKSVLYRSFIAAVLVFLAIWIGGRDITVGADTRSYANFYSEKVACKCFGSMEVGFEAVSLLPAFLGLGTHGFFFVVSLLSFILAAYIANRSSRGELQKAHSNQWRTELACFAAIFGVLLLNPLYAQSHINALRHGLAALCLVISILEFADGRRWRSVAWATVAMSFHISSALHLPFLLLSTLALGRHAGFVLWILTLFFGLYVTGASETLVQKFLPDLYVFVNDYGSHARQRYQTGVRWDFALFTYAVAVVSLLSTRLPGIRQSQAARTLIAAACLSSVPFFILGWGVFSNRYLFSSWIMFSLVLGLAAGSLIRSRAVPIPFGWGLLGLGSLFFVYQVLVG